MFKPDMNLDAINEVYRNANIALLSISNIIDEFEDGPLKKELSLEYESYEKLIGEMSAYMQEKGYEKKEVGAMKKLMMASAIKMNTAFDNTEHHIAELMIKGTVMGVTELCALINNSKVVTDKEIIEYAKKLKEMQETNEERLKKFL